MTLWPAGHALVCISNEFSSLCVGSELPWNISHTHTHTRWFLWFMGTFHRRNVFFLYKLYVLLPYTYPTPKLSPHRRRCISTFPQKTHSVWFISILNYGDTENVLINHLLLVIPMSYPCHYTNLCAHKPYKHATHTHAHTHTHTVPPSVPPQCMTQSKIVARISMNK